MAVLLLKCSLQNNIRTEQLNSTSTSDDIVQSHILLTTVRNLTHHQVRKGWRVEGVKYSEKLAGRPLSPDPVSKRLSAYYETSLSATGHGLRYCINCGMEIELPDVDTIDGVGDFCRKITTAEADRVALVLPFVMMLFSSI